MDYNKNINQKNIGKGNNNNRKNKLNIINFIIGIVLFIFILIIIISNYENQNDDEKDGSKIFKPIIAFILCFFIMFKIYNGLQSNKTTSVFNRFKIDKGLLIYLLLALIIAFII